MLCCVASRLAPSPGCFWSIVTAGSAPSPAAWTRFSFLRECSEARKCFLCLHLIGTEVYVYYWVLFWVAASGVSSGLTAVVVWGRDTARSTRPTGFMWLQLWLLHVWSFLNESVENRKNLLLFQKCKYWTTYCLLPLLKLVIWLIYWNNRIETF